VQRRVPRQRTPPVVSRTCSYVRTANSQGLADARRVHGEAPADTSTGGTNGEQGGETTSPRGGSRRISSSALAARSRRSPDIDGAGFCGPADEVRRWLDLLDPVGVSRTADSRVLPSRPPHPTERRQTGCVVNFDLKTERTCVRPNSTKSTPLAPDCARNELEVDPGT